MAVVSVRELNSNISKALARVEAGETLDISKNGKIVAELRPKGPVRDGAYWRARRSTEKRLCSGLPLNTGKVTEEDKYGDAKL
jgi:antitoxin (DNA-binding transcriptional repressor) of toxin-antitoxin stability system